MKVVQINSVSGMGSTGKIAEDISRLLNENNIENYILYSLGNTNHKNSIKFATLPYIKVNALKSRILGNFGFNSTLSTNNLIRKLKAIKPDIVHLHNLHSHDINIKILFKYLKKERIKVVWTFHDCWAFTGYCTYFDCVNCDKWRTKCTKCPLRKKSSWFFDNSAKLFKQKKRLFEGLDLTIVTPSKWLADLVNESFLKVYHVKVIHNGINLSIFKPTENNFKEEYNINDKYIILGVAFPWSERKGLDSFLKLSNMLDDRFRIVLVGCSKEQIMQLPANIIGIEKTNNQIELAQIYTAVDLFVNPTREEVLGMTNIEALACGTPVITFNTGGSPECIDETCGEIVEKGDINGLYNKINSLFFKDIPLQVCVNRAKNIFNSRDRYLEYLNLYKEVLKK